jgi:hypothetical protein
MSQLGSAACAAQLTDDRGVGGLAVEDALRPVPLTRELLGKALLASRKVGVWWRHARAIRRHSSSASACVMPSCECMRRHRQKNCHL